VLGGLGSDSDKHAAALGTEGPVSPPRSACAVTVIGQLEAAGVPQHVGVDGKGKPASSPVRATILRTPSELIGPWRSAMNTNPPRSGHSRANCRSARISPFDRGRAPSKRSMIESATQVSAEAPCAFQCTTGLRIQANFAGAGLDH
jgi:hypothetical protein